MKIKTIMVVAVVAFGIVSCTGPRYKIEPLAGETYTQQCGFDGSDLLTKKQAQCIALMSGFKKGSALWRIEAKTTKDGPVWEISSTFTGKYEEPNSNGEVITISRTTGEILHVRAWELIWL